ncbi:MATE family efflux transporter [Celeribacter litoreus]|uniref:MATE family efflux transporter n=1 Tax=Celeribacter litoreus TaxID=2876714 RepID=UPI001CCD49DC|nr:MATE family efflux transporter [Celeribacter litoreus]MCA0042869.1 MATE family efflux transporter [Celeribacter litoreus]
METLPVALSHRRVLKIALPIVLSNATVPILGAVDTGVVGQMGAAAPIGAVGIGAIILASFYWVFSFLRMGTTGLVSQARGARDDGEVAALLTRALMIGLTSGVILIMLQMPLLWAAFQISPATQEVESLARGYIAIRIWSAPFAIALFGITGWLIAQERTRGVLVLQLWMNGLNILLDLWFVIGLGWGVQGVALATVLAETSGAALGFWLCRDILRTPEWRAWHCVFDRVRLIHMAKVNTDILIRSVLLLVIIVSFTFLSAGFDDLTLAANQILMQFVEITAYALDGFAFAAEAIVGHALGARSRSAFRRGALLASLWGGIAAVFMTLVFAAFGGWGIDVMTTAVDVRAEARSYLPWMAVTPLMAFGAYMLDGIFIGATRTRDMRNMMFVTVAVYSVAVLTLIPIFGNHGLWAAMLISYVARCASLLWKYPALEASVETT